jgi:protein-disulfide isomerase
MRDLVVFVIAAVSFTGGYFIGKTQRYVPAPAVNIPVAAAPLDPTADAQKPDSIARQRVPVAGVLKGTPSAPITIVEFTDFQCPFCARATPTIEQLLKLYPGKIRFYVRHNPLPFHNSAPLAAEAALAAESEGKFWDMHDRLCENFNRLDRSDLEKHAQEIGLDLKRFQQALDTRVYKVRVEQDLAVAAQIGVRGTPTFYINGRLLSGAQPLEAFQEIIDDEIVIAEKLLASGTPPDKLYDTLVASAATDKTLR